MSTYMSRPSRLPCVRYVLIGLSTPAWGASVYFMVLAARGERRLPEELFSVAVAVALSLTALTVWCAERIHIAGGGVSSHAPARQPCTETAWSVVMQTAATLAAACRISRVGDIQAGFELGRRVERRKRVRDINEITMQL